MSQCTFWCSVLSDLEYLHYVGDLRQRLNAPFGAQCFPTLWTSCLPLRALLVSMHLLVLSAFRRGFLRLRISPIKVSMHLLVLSAFRPITSPCSSRRTPSLNAPFGAQCFPTLRGAWHVTTNFPFRLNAPFGAQCFPTRPVGACGRACLGLNASFGAQCFPTGFWWSDRVVGVSSLNAPFGAQCFPTPERRDQCCARDSVGLNAPFGAQCFPTWNEPSLTP